MPANDAAPLVVYLSSTVSDLQEERQAVRDVLRDFCVVKESYDASDASLVQKCLDDIGTCEIYIGIVGLRYGFIPPGRDGKSITHLEYDQARARGLRRFVFIKDEAEIKYTRTDAGTGENPPGRISDFRKQLASGADDEGTPARFKDIADLKLAVQKVVHEARYERSRKAPVLLGERPHPWTVAHEVSIGCVPGTDDSLKAILENLASGDQRIAVFDLSPSQPRDHLASLDAQVRRSRSIILLLTPSSLSRIAGVAADIAAGVAMVRQRAAAVFGLLVDATPDALPPALAQTLTDVFVTTRSDWSAQAQRGTFDALQQWRRARAPEAPASARVSVPYMVIALKDDEAKAMHGDPKAFFAAFGTSAEVRRTQFTALSTRLKQVPSEWPEGFYGPSRRDWRPFGPSDASMEQFVEAAADRVNRAERGTRERRLLRTTQIAPLPYAFDEYLIDRSGSRENARRVCDLGCLVLVDEFALLHPALRGRVDQLLGSNNAAVVAISACDPALGPLRELMTDDVSYLRGVGNLLSRFRDLEDLRCELALNSAGRLQRWLRLVLPEVLTTLGQDHVDPQLAGNVDALLLPSGAGT